MSSNHMHLSSSLWQGTRNSELRREMEREHQNASLQSPLIQFTGQDGFIVDAEQNKPEAIERREILDEVRKQLWLSGPLISVSLLNYCLQVISVMFVGHLGELALSGASMATSFASVTSFSLLVSLFSLPSLSYWYNDITNWILSFVFGFAIIKISLCLKNTKKTWPCYCSCRTRYDVTIDKWKILLKK